MTTLNCEINFDQNVNGVYFAGQLVSGSVILNLSKPKRLRAICLRLHGGAMCQWTENVSNKKHIVKSVQYMGHEDYISTSTYLVPGSDDGFELKPGSHRYTFACALPQVLPTSYEGTYGHVRYTAKVILERPWKFDHTYQVAFTILKELNLNYMIPNLRIPSQVEFTKHFGCGPCRSPPLSVLASVPQTGYVPGQIITITASIDNASNSSVNAMHYMLRKLITYNSQRPNKASKTECQVIAKYKDVGVAAKSNGNFEIRLAVPPVPATNMDKSSCSIIHIEYDVMVEAKVSGPHTITNLSIPITIGTVPLTLNTMEPLHHNKGFPDNPISGEPTSGPIVPSAPIILTPNPERHEFNGGHPLMEGVGGAGRSQSQIWT